MIQKVIIVGNSNNLLQHKHGDIINSFESNSKTRTSRYKDYHAYVYRTYENKITSSKEN